MNTMLNSSILYASETYHNLKETQLYLTLGQIPACFSIIKIRMPFLKYILDEDDDDILGLKF